MPASSSMTAGIARSCFDPFLAIAAFSVHTPMFPARLFKRREVKGAMRDAAVQAELGGRD